MLGLLALLWRVFVGEGLDVLVLAGWDGMKKAYKKRLPTILEKKNPQRERLPCCGLVFNLSRPDARLQFQHPHPTARTDAITGTRIGSSQRGRGKRTANG